MLDDNDHTQAKSGVRPLVLEFGQGQWKSRSEAVQFACIGPNGAASTQATTQVLSLRPQPVGDLVGEMVVTVHSNECGQQERSSASRRWPVAVVICRPQSTCRIP